MLRPPIAAGAALGVVALAVGSLLPACGLEPVVMSNGDVTGVANGHAQPDTPSATTTTVQSADAGSESDAVVSPARCSTSSTRCTAALEDGWTPIALPIAQDASCPSSYTTYDFVKASASNDACTCVPLTSPQDPPSCDKDDSYSGGVSFVVAACIDGSGKIKVDGSACVPVSGGGWISGKFDPIVHLGTCVPSCVANPSKVTRTGVRVCVPSRECTEDTCIGASSGGSSDGVRFCFAHDGDVSCPADAGFADRQVVGSDAMLTCEGATCANDVTCENAKLHLFNDGACSGAESGSINADGKCNSIATGPKGLRYTATKKPLPSKMVDAGTPTVDFVGARTICCHGPS